MTDQYTRQTIDALRRALNDERTARLNAHERHEKRFAELERRLAVAEERLQTAINVSDMADQQLGRTVGGNGRAA